MNAHDVLYVSPVLQNQPILELVKELHAVIDEDSVHVLNTLIGLDIFEDTSSGVKEFGVLELQKDVPFVQITKIIEDEKYLSASPSRCVHFLSSLKGKENTEVRRSFFARGIVLLSSDPIIIQGKLHYLVMGQNQYDQKNGQRPFSIRLLTPPKVFLHSLYRVLVVRTMNM